MGGWGMIFFSEQIAQLEEFKKMLTNADEIEQVEQTIALLKSKKGE